MPLLFFSGIKCSHTVNDSIVESLAGVDDTLLLQCDEWLRSC